MVLIRSVQERKNISDLHSSFFFWLSHMKNKLDELNKRLHTKGSTEGKGLFQKQSDKFCLLVEDLLFISQGKNGIF
jgi:hypothetical protein